VTHPKAYWLTCILTVLWASIAGATTIVMPTDEQLIAKSPLIVEGTVVHSAAVDRGNAIWTETTVSVANVIKGQLPVTGEQLPGQPATGNGQQLTIREIGGVLDNRITKIFGAPEYHDGEHVLLFLTPTPRGDYQTVDLYVGKFSEETTLAGQRLWARHDDAGDVTLLDHDFNPVAPSHMQRDATNFEQYINDRVAGKPGIRNYDVLNPVVVNVGQDLSLSSLHGQAESSSYVVSPDFTMISEPTIYRWFAFENGQSAKWYSNGTQPGYSGGGVNEVQTAINVWTGYTSALIKYSYAGTTTTMGGLDAPNGVNEILFNDPKGEIAGSWNPATGGVVGQGGFNGIAGAQTWNAPFTADATHTQKAYSAYNITEGNLTIQDNVSSTTGISSATLAEIVAHEFGHTLGFGHSTDPTALMYASVSPGGPSLRSDDQTAARWLYQNGNHSGGGGGTPTVPAAPTGLTASPSGANVTLTWNDNATDETAQSIFMSIGTGAFSKVTDLAANQTSVTLTGFGTGTYRFYVTASNSVGSSAQSNTVSVTISASITPAFTYTQTTGTAGTTTFTFTDQTSGTVTSRAWSFGDGTASSGSTVSHIYGNAGTYTITLTINGSAQVSHTVAVSATPVALGAAFTWTPFNPNNTQAVNFIDQSSGTPAAWQWSFGDGTQSSLQNPAKQYSVAGTYTVTLTVLRSGTASSSTSHTISVANAIPATPPVTAAFSSTPNAPTAGETVSFSDQSTGTPTSWQWNFGDGFTTSAQSPTHVYAVSGTYNVTLSVANAVSNSSVTHAIVVAQAAVPYRALVSVITQAAGVGGSSWRTELTIFNAGNEAVTPSLIFFPGAGGQVQTRPIYRAPKQSVTYANALSEIFGLVNSAGALGIEADGVLSSPDLRVSSRTFTDSATGTYGQAVGGVMSDDLPSTVYLTGLESDASFRTNIGFVNRSGAPVGATVELFDGTGTRVATGTMTFPANNFQQTPLTSLFPNLASAQYQALSMRVTAGAANAISTYASVVDNRSQDPVYLQGAGTPVGGRLVIPAVGRVPGANGTFWRSDVTFYNPTGSTMQLALRYQPAGSDNRFVNAVTLNVGGGKTTVLADVLNWLGISSGSGALDVRWNSAIGPVVASRTYTTTTGGGTYGQSIDPVTEFGNDAYVPGLRGDFTYRSNVGFVNGGDTTIGVTTQLLGTNGQVLAQGFVTLSPRSQVQMTLAQMFPSINPQSLGSVTLKAHADGQPDMFAYGSIIDNTSGDPVFFAGR